MDSIESILLTKTTSLTNAGAKSCMVCGSLNQKALFEEVADLEYGTYKPVNFFLCKNCGLIYQLPLPSLMEVLSFYPPDYRNFLLEKENLFYFLKQLQFKNLALKISKYFDKQSKVLEIGVGNGNLLLALRQLGYKNLFGIDFNENAFTKLKDKNIKVQAENAENGIPFNEYFDVVIMNNVIEHFLDPLKVLKNCKEKLSGTGKIIFLTPNSDALDFLIFQRFWAGLHTPRHTFLFNKKNVEIICENLGLLIFKVEPISDPGQWSISVQNVFQSIELTKTKLKCGMAWYTVPLTFLTFPITLLQNLIGRSTSLMYVIVKSIES